jgi:hypothetical protein
MRLNATNISWWFTGDSPTVFKENDVIIFNGLYAGPKDIVGSF